MLDPKDQTGYTYQAHRPARICSFCGQKRTCAEYTRLPRQWYSQPERIRICVFCTYDAMKKFIGHPKQDIPPQSPPGTANAKKARQGAK